MGRFYYILLTSILMSLIALPCRASDNVSPVQRMSHLLAQLKKNPNDVQALIDASISYIDLNDYDGAKRMASRLETVSRHDSDSVRALFYSRLLTGWASLMAGQGRNGFESVSEACKIAKGHEMTAELALADNLLGFGYINLDFNLSQGLKHYNDALSYAKAADDYKLVISILNNLSDAYLWCNDLSGVKYAEEALKLSREQDYNYGIINSLLHIIHFRLFLVRDYDDISRMMSEVERLQNKYGYLSPSEISLLKARMAMASENYTCAVTLFKESLDNAGPEAPTLLKIETFMYYSWALIRMGKFDESIAISKDALSLAMSSGYDRFSPFLLSSIAYCYEKLGNYQQAFSYLKDYHIQMDGLLILEQIKDLNQARVENEVRLNESKISRQQSQLTARGHYIILLTGIGAILVSCLLLLFNLYRRKGQLVRTVIEREKEAVLREKLLKQSLEQTRAELSEAGKNAATPPLSEDRMDDLMVKLNELMIEKKLYTDTNISIKSVAEALGTNRTYLSNAINHVFNKSFPQVLAEYRVRAAINMLNDRDCDLPLKAIAAEVGFSSASVFFTTFRNIMGMTPTAYRNSLDR